MTYLLEVWNVLLELAPSLLVGLFLAGLLHVFLPKNLVRRQMSENSLGSVLKAVLVGVPMPLCSCGVVPTAIGLKNDGASAGASTGFLISTPQTGVDSILVSASFLGWPFALFKVAAAFVTGFLGGALVTLTEPKAQASILPVHTISDQTEAAKPWWRRLGSYMVYDLLGAIDTWLILGVLAAALIATWISPGYLSTVSWTQGIGGMLLALVISLPLYVCTTSSVPIAASLIAAGMPTGTALVFLMAGPATNLATMGAVYRALGGRVLGIYLATVSVLSMAFGLVFDSLLPGSSVSKQMMHHHGDAGWLSMLSAGLLVLLLAWTLAKKLMLRFQSKTLEEKDMDLLLTVKGMNCGHCVAAVKRAVESEPGVEEATPDLAKSKVAIRGDNLDKDSIKARIVQAGYQVEE